MSKLKEQWEKYLDTVPGLVDVVVPQNTPLGDDDAEYRAFAADLPADIAERMAEAPNQADEPPWEKVIEHQWCLCEMPEADFPRVYAFPSLKRLVEALAKREGNETAVWPMFGVPLRLTKALPNPKKPGALTRYLLLPNQLAAVVSSNEGFQLIPQTVLPDSLEMQDEGWLGDPDLLKEQGYFIDGFVEEDEFSTDPDMGSDDDDGEDPNYIEE
jgi:hypothetical protein